MITATLVADRPVKAGTGSPEPKLVENQAIRQLAEREEAKRREEPPARPQPTVRPRPTPYAFD